LLVDGRIRIHTNIKDPDADPKGPKTGSGTLAGTGSRRAKITHKLKKIINFISMFFYES
jgi:hypothetical protein